MPEPAQPKLVRITTMPVSLKVLLKGQMRFMKAQGFEVTMISSDGPEIPSLIEQEDCKHLTVKLTRKISPLTDLLALVKLTFMLRKLKPDIVHTHTPKAGLIGMWAAWLAAVPIRLHTIAGLPWVESKGMMRTLLKTVERLTAWPAHKIYPNSFVQRDFLMREGIATKKLEVLGSGSSNGINSHYFSRQSELITQAATLRAAENVSPEAIVWIFVGRLVKDKGICELLDAFVRLQEIFPEDRLWLLGEEEPELDPLDADHLHLLHDHPAVRTWGFQTDIRPFLAASQVLLFPSYREGFPNVPLQAGSMGCALILSNINGCNEIVQDGENGLLVPPKDTDALADAMFQLRNNEKLREQMAIAIEQKIKTAYDQHKLWQTLLATYKGWLLTKTKRK